METNGELECDPKVSSGGPVVPADISLETEPEGLPLVLIADDVVIRQTFGMRGLDYGVVNCSAAGAQHRLGGRRVLACFDAVGHPICPEEKTGLGEKDMCGHTVM